MYFLGLMGMTRRIYTYSAGLGWTPLNVVATIGAVLMGIGFIVLCYNVYYSARYGERDMTGDPWDGRTLEWATASPPAHYNFPITPEVTDLDAYWVMKKNGNGFEVKEEQLKPIHMPSNSGRPFLISIAFFFAGFGLVFKWFTLAIVAAVFIILGLILRSFDDDDGYYISVDEIKRTERLARKGA
jgi:cytochrome aa3-600 menaquinol oxidase subunit 1